jgi:hypothetical protein
VSGPKVEQDLVVGRRQREVSRTHPGACPRRARGGAQPAPAGDRTDKLRQPHRLPLPPPALQRLRYVSRRPVRVQVPVVERGDEGLDGTWVADLAEGPGD